MAKRRVLLLGALALVGAVEVAGVHGDSDTISALTVDAFRVNTPVGRGVFIISWLGFAAWYGWHILSWRLPPPE